MLYVSSSCLNHNYISETIKQMAQSGIKNIELSGGTEYYDKIENDLIHLKQEYDLKYACHAYFPPPKHPFVVNLASCNDMIYKKSIEHYEQCIKMLKRIDCKTLSVHAGFLVEVTENQLGKKLNDRVIYNEQEAYDRFCTAYKYISDLCKQNDIELYLENNVLNSESYQECNYCNYMMMTDFNSIMKMKEKLHFNLLLDLGHLYVSTHTLSLDYAQECGRLSEYVKWIHLSENNGWVDEHKPLRQNSEIIRSFYKIKKGDINVTLETVSELNGILDSIQLVSDYERQ